MSRREVEYYEDGKTIKRVMLDNSDSRERYVGALRAHLEHAVSMLDGCDDEPWMTWIKQAQYLLNKETG